MMGVDYTIERLAEQHGRVCVSPGSRYADRLTRVCTPSGKEIFINDDGQVVKESISFHVDWSQDA